MPHSSSSEAASDFLRKESRSWRHLVRTASASLARVTARRLVGGCLDALGAGFLGGMISSW